MPYNSLVMLRENFRLDREWGIVEVTATHPILGKRSVLVALPLSEEWQWEEYAMKRWIEVVM